MCLYIFLRFYTSGAVFKKKKLRAARQQSAAPRQEAERLLKMAPPLKTETSQFATLCNYSLDGSGGLSRSGAAALPAVWGSAVSHPHLNPPGSGTLPRCAQSPAATSAPPPPCRSALTRLKGPDRSRLPASSGRQEVHHVIKFSTTAVGLLLLDVIIPGKDVTSARVT